MKSIVKVSIFAMLFVITACSTSSTGRKQVLLFSPDKLNQMGSASFDELKKQEKISKNKAVNQFVQCVANGIIPQVPQSVHKGAWEIVVFDSEQVNAFALPGGKIGVYTGILKVTENQDQLAAIIGHEVGHVIEQHSNERMSSKQLSQTGMAVAGLVMTSQEVKHQDKWMMGLGLGLHIGVLMPYSRSHESEADIIGQELMARSGFKPQASVKLWQNMSKLSQAKGKTAPAEFMSTHPSNNSRIKALTAHLPKSNALLATKLRPQCIKPKL